MRHLEPSPHDSFTGETGVTWRKKTGMCILYTDTCEMYLCNTCQKEALGEKNSKCAHCVLHEKSLKTYIYIHINSSLKVFFGTHYLRVFNVTKNTQQKTVFPPTCVGMPKEMGSVTPNLENRESFGGSWCFLFGRIDGKVWNVFSWILWLIVLVDLGTVLIFVGGVGGRDGKIWEKEKGEIKSWSTMIPADFFL